jgi:signal transduction histidine kinase
MATGVAGIISILIGTFMANRLTSPISRVIKNARQIAAGKFDDRIIENSNTREIVELTESINSLATTLGKQEVLRKRLTADVAHELRTPLSCVQSHLEAMIDGIWEPSKERLESCHEETVRLSKMVSDLGKLAQYDGENVTLKKEYFSLSELLSRLLKNFEKEFQKKQINLVTNIQDQNIEADEDKLTQVLVNLFSNALKYTPDGGTIEINTTGTKEYIEVSVKDTGIGIAEKDLPYIFERFYRVDQSRNRMTGGSGIGLAIAKSLVEAHNGTIEVKSEEGVGSEFIVRIPS